ncbi:YLR173W [Saccharomyces arboricola H-6]|uniref:YLR173W n=1 Tax=Saccharomyces arboricola (strain H-6 / AS 2.3317 / CBS 10644) TaxID=1160507 RepID=J8LKU0_SACAR|nr:YLR173W [Saccharomyces arboricola H-6]
MDSHSPAHVDREDLETQPLLRSDTEEGQLLDDGVRIDVANKSLRESRIRSLKHLGTYLLSVILLGLFGIGIVQYIRGHVPPTDVIEKSIVQITNFKLVEFQIDGWKDDMHSSLNNDTGKYLQVSIHSQIWLDYDKWPATGNNSDENGQRDWIRYVNEKVIKNICIDLNNVTTFDGDLVLKDKLGDVVGIDPICVDLAHRKINDLHFKVLIKPSIWKIVKVLKKFWNGDFDSLNLKSNLDMIIFKKKFGMRLNLLKLNDEIVNWSDIIDWEKVLSAPLQAVQKMINAMSLRGFTLRDSDSSGGFHANMNLNPITILRDIHWLRLPPGATIPFINWEVKLPDCNGEPTIAIPTLSCFNEPIILHHDRDNIVVCLQSEIEGPLPDELLYDECPQNSLTPMSQIVNAVLNQNETFTFATRGHIIQDGIENNPLIPADILDNMLQEISFIPITTNATFNSSELIQEFQINDLQLRWAARKRLSLVGSFLGIFDLSFYETHQRDQVCINTIRGQIDLYHNDINFLNLPMKQWVNSTSHILHDQDTGKTQMELQFDLKNDDTEVVDSLELTRTLNEILFQGFTTIHFNATIDASLTTALGPWVLTGLTGEGDTLVT